MGVHQQDGVLSLFKIVYDEFCEINCCNKFLRENLFVNLNPQKKKWNILERFYSDSYLDSKSDIRAFSND